MKKNITMELPDGEQISIIYGTQGLTPKQKKVLTAFEKDFKKLLNKHFKAIKREKECNENELQLSGTLVLGFQHIKPQKFKILARTFALSTGGFNAISEGLTFVDLLAQAIKNKTPNEKQAFFQQLVKLIISQPSFNRPEIF